MVRKYSEAYSISEGIYIFLVLFTISNFLPIMFTKQYRYLRKEPVERIPVRITYNSRHIILSYCCEIKQQNTSRYKKYRSKFGGVGNMEV